MLQIIHQHIIFFFSLFEWFLGASHLFDTLVGRANILNEPLISLNEVHSWLGWLRLVPTVKLVNLQLLDSLRSLSNHWLVDSCLISCSLLTKTHRNIAEKVLLLLVKVSVYAKFELWIDLIGWIWIQFAWSCCFLGTIKVSNNLLHRSVPNFALVILVSFLSWLWFLHFLRCSRLKCGL